MGQQQLLLLVLSAIIVGVAIMAGIDTFSDGATKANRDAVEQDLASMAAQAQTWYLKPQEMGGGGSSFANLTLTRIGFPVDGSDVYVNANGSYQLDGIPSETTMKIKVTPSNSDGQELYVQISPGSFEIKEFADAASTQ